jgi:catechol 2,3-dioxygenase-like lactoylglutathione lyase family enzyme
MHLLHQPLWFWLILGLPGLSLFSLWALARFGRVSLRPLKPWVRASLLLAASIYIFVGLLDDHKTLRLVCWAALYSIWGAGVFIERRYKFETLAAPGAKWYIPAKSAEFSIPTDVRVVVRNVDSVSPWYVEKLGLRKLAENPWGEPVATYQFKEEENSVILTTRRGFETDKTPILFTKKIDKMKAVLAARGVSAGPIECDRQGTRYFEIRDPEGNLIEIVEEP